MKSQPENAHNVVSLDDFKDPRRQSQNTTASLDPGIGGRIGTDLTQLYRDHWGTLCKRLRHVFGDGPPEAEDLAQAAFTKIISLRPSTSITNLPGYLFRVALNKGLDETRSAKRARLFIERELQAIGGPPVEDLGPANVYESEEALANVQQIVERLPHKQHEILIRARIRGETYAQISAATGWSQAAISRQLAAALSALQTATRDA